LPGEPSWPQAKPAMQLPAFFADILELIHKFEKGADSFLPKNLGKSLKIRECFKAGFF
jgi:hypothetical protein